MKGFAHGGEDVEFDFFGHAMTVRNEGSTALGEDGRRRFWRL